MLQLAAGKDGARRGRELLEAISAFEQAPLPLGTRLAVPNGAGDPVRDSAVAMRAERLAFGLGIAKRHEGILCLFLGHASYALEIKRPCSSRKKKMLRLTLQCVTFASDVTRMSQERNSFCITSVDSCVIRERYVSYSGR